MKKLFTVSALLALSTFLMAQGRPSVQDMVRSEAVRQGVPVSLALAIAKKESNFKCHVIGTHGERGVMQIKPVTARGVGYRGPISALNNCHTGILYGMIYLKMAYKKSGGNVYKTALLYNGGLGTRKSKSKYAEEIHKKTRNR